MRVFSSGYYPQPPDELVSLTIHGRDRAIVHTDFNARSFWSHLNTSFASRAQHAQIQRLHGMFPHEKYFFCPQVKTSNLGLRGILGKERVCCQ